MLDGNQEQVAHAWSKIGLFGEQKNDMWLLSTESNT